MSANILLIEYERRNVEEVRAALTGRGHRLEIAGDLNTAVDVCAHFEPKIVIIASEHGQVPVGDAITQLRARAGLRVTPFLILVPEFAGEDPRADSVVGAAGIVEAQELVRHVVIAEHVQDYAIRLVLTTHPQGEFAAEVTNRFIRFGSSPRGVQALVLAGKVRAMLDERYHVSFDDIESAVLPALRHRILLNFEGQAEGITADALLADILRETPKTLEQKLDVP